MGDERERKIVHKHEVSFVPMPVTEIKPGKSYLLGVDPDLGYSQPEVMQEIVKTLNESFPGSKFIMMQGLYSVSEQADEQEG